MAANVTLGCLVKGFFPGPVEVAWDTGTLNHTEMTLPAATLDSGLSTTVSQVTAMGAWAKQMFTCHVVHAPTTTHTNKTFRGEHLRGGQPSMPGVLGTWLAHSSAPPIHSMQGYLHAAHSKAPPLLLRPSGESDLCHPAPVPHLWLHPRTH